LEDAHKILKKFSPGPDGISVDPEGMACIKGHEFRGINRRWRHRADDKFHVTAENSCWIELSVELPGRLFFRVSG
jgi:hypothetical protein